ncbi:MAG: hypothetical protein ACLFV2_04260 [Desulfurivibrionaceae bacterium]
MKSGLKLIAGIIVGFILVWTIFFLTEDKDPKAVSTGKGSPRSFNSTDMEVEPQSRWNGGDDNGNSAERTIANQAAFNPERAQSGDNMTAAGVYSDSSLHRQYFWKPFETKLRAKGFAETLCRNNRLNCGVEELEEGGFRIYFEYTDQADLESKLALLRESSGFDSLQTDN